jgi:hypothetical protein
MKHGGTDDRFLSSVRPSELVTLIRNEKQYRITKAQVRRFQDAIAELTSRARPANISPRLWEAQRQAAQSQMEELQEQVDAYERLQAGKSTDDFSRELS